MFQLNFYRLKGWDPEGRIFGFWEVLILCKASTEPELKCSQEG